MLQIRYIANMDGWIHCIFKKKYYTCVTDKPHIISIHQWNSTPMLTNNVVCAYICMERAVWQLWRYVLIATHGAIQNYFILVSLCKMLSHIQRPVYTELHSLMWSLVYTVATQCYFPVAVGARREERNLTPGMHCANVGIGVLGGVGFCDKSKVYT